MVEGVLPLALTLAIADMGSTAIAPAQSSVLLAQRMDLSRPQSTLSGPQLPGHGSSSESGHAINGDAPAAVPPPMSMPATLDSGSGGNLTGDMSTLPPPVSIPSELFPSGIDPATITGVLNAVDHFTSGGLESLPIPSEILPGSTVESPSIANQIDAILSIGASQRSNPSGGFEDLGTALPLQPANLPNPLIQGLMDNRSARPTAAIQSMDLPDRLAISRPSSGAGEGDRPTFSLEPMDTPEVLFISVIEGSQIADLSVRGVTRLSRSLSTLDSRSQSSELGASLSAPSGGGSAAGGYAAPVCPTVGEPLAVGLRKFVKLTQDLSKTRDRENRFRLERELYEQGLKLPELAGADPTLKQAMEGTLALDCDQLVTEVTATLQQVADYLGAMRDIRTGILW
ncbi:MAG: hypothetical protein HC921_03305 [Synechococcaceae cyanobacterium SM2_3_1]|nr:hypothetical protein [Synechococcaceae cyanobacterium SM2_3_1]